MASKRGRRRRASSRRAGAFKLALTFRQKIALGLLGAGAVVYILLSSRKAGAAALGPPVKSVVTAPNGTVIWSGVPSKSPPLASLPPGSVVTQTDAAGNFVSGARTEGGPAVTPPPNYHYKK